LLLRREESGRKRGAGIVGWEVGGKEKKKGKRGGIAAIKKVARFEHRGKPKSANRGRRSFFFFHEKKKKRRSPGFLGTKKRGGRRKKARSLLSLRFAGDKRGEIPARREKKGKKKKRGGGRRKEVTCGLFVLLQRPCATVREKKKRKKSGPLLD